MTAMSPVDEDSPVPPAVSSTVLKRVRVAWAGQLSIPVDALRSAGTRFFAREGATAVVALELGGARVLVAPPSACSRLGSLDEELLLDVDTLASRLGQFQPRPIGVASLAYGDARPRIRGSVGVEPADRAMVEALRHRCSTDEWDESGLSQMPHRWAGFTSGGHLAAVAGYERWGTDIAQLGVVADPSERGRGYATAAAGAAMTAALDDGLVAQWRCRVGNTASERLADSLGLTRLGRQAAVALLAGED